MKAKAKKDKRLRGAAWHAARNAKKKFQEKQAEEEEEAAPTWVPIFSVKAGLNVMKGVFHNELSLVRVHKVDRGVDNMVVVYDLNGQQIHSLITEQAKYQKIKE